MTRRKKVLLLLCLAAFLACVFFFRQYFPAPGSSDEGEYEIYSRHYVMITGREDGDFWDRV